MTSRHTTGLLSLRDQATTKSAGRGSDFFYRLAFGAIGWPWLLLSLWGGTQRDKQKLLERVQLGNDSLPNLGSWKADTGFLHRIVDAVEELRPQVVVELGAGATTLVCAKAMQQHGQGKLYSFDQHADFVEATGEWLASEGVQAQIGCAPLTAEVEGWPGRWYDLGPLPDQIDLIVIDGPPWAVHPFVRGGAEILFERLAPGGIILLDDAARPGERIVAKRWRQRWPDISFERVGGSSKGTLVGRKAPAPEHVGRKPSVAANDNAKSTRWRRAAAIGLLFASGWLTNEVTGDFSSPASAASFVNEAQEAYHASRVRQKMASQIESIKLNRTEILDVTGIVLPPLPAEWTILDAQLYPSDLGNSVMVSLKTDSGETISLFAANADTSFGALPMMDAENGISVAYWEEGSMAVGLVGEVESSRLLELAAIIARQT